MTVQPAPARTAGRPKAADILLDGLIAGALGALTAALLFLVVDLMAGRPFHTPALLGAALLNHGSSTPQAAVSAPTEVLAYTGFHALVFVVVGVGFSWLFARLERFPMLGVVLLSVFMSLELFFFALDVALGARLLSQLRSWPVIVANALAAVAISAYLWKRHPRITEGVRQIWDDEP